ncbi:MAG TPA: sigma-70 family RNA polymerase sigma factor [Thermoanaerobaculia bacterium]|nr:sigma-70 family RNA polymerase sigma factor [Thermoanaerobaculia bacterium]
MPDAELAAFYEEIFMPLVRRATWRHRLSKEDARDVVQDAFLLAIEKIDAAGNPKAWLIQVVDHLALNHLRKQVRRSKLLSKWSRGDSELATDQRSVASRGQQP